MAAVVQLGEMGTELSAIVQEVNDRQTQIVIESAGQPVVAVVPYGYLMNLLEALEDAIDSKLLKNAVSKIICFASSLGLSFFWFITL